MSDIKRLEKQLKRERSFISIVIIILAIVTIFFIKSIHDFAIYDINEYHYIPIDTVVYNKIMPDSSVSSDTIIIKHKQ
jgi:hypothetical protein